jgi:hypothetical protein
MPYNYGYYNRITSGFSFTVLYKPTDLETGAGRDTLFDFTIGYTGTSGNAAWFTDTGKLVLGGRSTISDSFASKTTTNAIITVEEWAAIGGVINYNNKTISIYKNGKLFEPFTTVTFLNNYYIYPHIDVTTVTDKIGMTSAVLHPLNGIMMYFIIYPRALTATEIHNLYLYIKQLAVSSGVTI